MASIKLFFLLNAPQALAQIYSFPTTSLFVPVEYVSNTFRAYIASSDATATTYVFSPGCEDRSCGPVTVIQGPGTALFNETDQPITTIYNCTLYPTTSPTSASCLLSSTSPGYAFPGPVTKTYPENSGYAFPLYEALITATGSPPDVWGFDSTATSHRASLFLPLTEAPGGGALTTTTAAATDASATTGSSTGTEAVVTSMPSSTPAVTAMSSTPEAASSSAAPASASTTTSMSTAGRATMPLTSLLVALVCALLGTSSTL